jgi:hypothetical protein
MLQTFEMAKMTVVHEQDLVNFKWRDDGSPAVALILSSWFTRGWTAAELWASRNHPVKVLFADPDDPSRPPLIKDLDDDVLAEDLDHWLVRDEPSSMADWILICNAIGASRPSVKDEDEIDEDYVLISLDIWKGLKPRILQKIRSLKDFLGMKCRLKDKYLIRRGKFPG